MKRLPQRAPRRGHTGKLERKATARETSEGTAARSADKVSLDFLMLRNVHDHLAVDKLRSTPVGALAVDRLVRNDPQMVPLMREALVEVYFRAAQARELSRATKRQINNAKSALNSLTQAIEYLERVSTDGRDGLRMLLEGPPLDDEKGEREVNQMASACWGIRLEVVRSMHALQTTSSLNPKSRSMSASVVSDFERWSKLSHPGGWRGEERPSRPTSRPIDVMVIAQSFMDVPESFWDLRCTLQCGCFQKIGGRGGCDERARNATSVEQLRERRCGLTCPYFVFSMEHPRGHCRPGRRQAPEYRAKARCHPRHIA